MKEIIKNILKKAGIYYSMQGRYRSFLFYGNVLLTRIKYSKYKGSGFTCNFCGNKYKIFAPGYASEEDSPALKKYKVIAGNGESVYCPYCGSTCRERLVLQMLIEKIDCENKKILHLSPEKQIFDFLKKRSVVITADIEPGFYKLIDKNIIYADAGNLPFENEAFDIVIGNHIMEHIPEDTVAMKEIFRVLKPTGKAVVQIPFSEIIPGTIEEPYISDSKKQSELFGQKDHVRIYSLDDYINRLSKAGLTVNYIPPEKLREWSKYAIQPREGFFDCVKS